MFTSNSDSFTLSIPPYGLGGVLTVSGTGVNNNSSVLQTFDAGDSGQIVFNNASTAASAQMQIVNHAGPHYDCRTDSLQRYIECGRRFDRKR